MKNNVDNHSVKIQMNMNSRNDGVIKPNIVKTQIQQDTIPTLQEASIITENYPNIEGGTVGNKTTDNRTPQDIGQIPANQKMFQTLEEHKQVKEAIESPKQGETIRVVESSSDDSRASAGSSSSDEDEDDA